MIDPVLLNLLKVLGKAIYFIVFFRIGFNKFNNTGPRMLDSIYHMTLKLF